MNCFIFIFLGKTVSKKGTLVWAFTIRHLFNKYPISSLKHIDKYFWLKNCLFPVRN